MALKQFKPYTKSTRSTILIDKSTKYLTTNQFLEAIDGNLRKKLN